MSKTDPKSTDIKAAVDKAAEDQKAVDAKATEEQTAADAKAAEEKAAADAKAAEEKAAEDQSASDAKAAEEKAAEEQAAADAKVAEVKAAEEQGEPVVKAEIDVERVKSLIEQVEARNGHSILQLVHRLQLEEGLKEVPSDGDDQAKKLVMAGVTCRVHATPDRTLQNWANAARRALLKAA
tara:strand:+ start:8074 stop:8616 length:543 start_codon:yes stop_codon:yes gene_type:complete